MRAQLDRMIAKKNTTRSHHELPERDDRMSKGKKKRRAQLESRERDLHDWKAQRDHG